jgi:hypothetical protein
MEEITAPQRYVAGTDTLVKGRPPYVAQTGWLKHGPLEQIEWEGRIDPRWAPRPRGPRKPPTPFTPHRPNNA